MAATAGAARLNLTATPWVTLDLSQAVFMHNPATPGTPFGQYTGGKIQPITFGSGVSIYFQHPDLPFTALDPGQAYEFEFTYDATSNYSWGEIEAVPLATVDSWWNDPSPITIRTFGMFSTSGVPTTVFTVGPQEPFYQADWANSVAQGRQGLVFNHSNRTIIEQIRYRATDPPRADAFGSASLSFSASDSTPIDTSSPFTIDTTFTTMLNTGTMVGSGDILNDGSDATYYQLDGYNNVTSPDILLSGWLLIDVPPLPNYYGLVSLSLTARAEFYGITGTPTKASLRFFLTDATSADPLQYSVSNGGGYYALVLPGGTYPETTALPTGITNYSYGTTDFQVQSSSLSLSERLWDPLVEGKVALGFAPQRHFSDNYLTTRVQCKIYELEFTITYNEYVAPVFNDPPDLPQGYGDWQELPLSTAVFLEYLGAPTGLYDAERDRIVSYNGSTWPDFYFPGLFLDPDNDYMFWFAYDSYDVRDSPTANHDLYAWTVLASGDPQDEYDNGLSGSSVSDDASGDYGMFLWDSADYRWEYLAQGYTRPIFDSDRYGVLAKLYYAVSPGTPDSYIPPPTFVDEHVRAQAHFWGQR